ncbi:MAG: hypothetical protein HC836_10565 [Richelia sp. RM2_1_2]|nr:hypothetical protein [Richelia sp. RM2_1_2]
MMSVFSRNWSKAVQLEVFRGLKTEPRPKGSGKGVKGSGLKFTDLFPNLKPGEGGFNIYAGKGKKGGEAEAGDSE